MRNEYMTVRIDEKLKRKVTLMAKEERRRFSDQVLFLMEKGLERLEKERREQPVSAGETAK